MAAEAESTRLANAKIIVAKSEIETIKNLQVATTLLMENPMSMQVRLYVIFDIVQISVKIPFLLFRIILLEKKINT